MWAIVVLFLEKKYQIRWTMKNLTFTPQIAKYIWKILYFLCFIIELAARYMHQYILQVTSFFPKELLTFTVDLCLHL